MATRWWSNEPNERYWLEATDREDVGVDLHAPMVDNAGRENWRYTLFLEAAPGDVVFHYDGKANAIVARSVIAGPSIPIKTTWAARGSYARARKAEPEILEGYSVPLRDSQSLTQPVTLEAIRAARPAIEEAVSTLRARHGKAPLYFPFELSARPVRPLQGYAFKLPAVAVSVLGLDMANQSKDLTISEDRLLVSQSFSKWRAALLDGAVREKGLWRQPTERFVFRNQSDPASAQLGSRTALGEDPTGEDWIVQVNEPNFDKDSRIITAIATDQSGREYLLRQGRLNANRLSSTPILGEDFRLLSGLTPVAISNDSTAISRDWYIVTPLDADNSVIRRNTAEFVNACVMARTGGRGVGSLDDLKRASEISGNDETGGSYMLGAKSAVDEKEVRLLQGEVWQRMAVKLRKLGISVAKVRHASGYEIDAEIVNGQHRLLVEIKTGTNANDVYAGVGQLMLYAKLFPRLLEYTPVLLLPRLPRKPLADAVAECGVQICTFETDFRKKSDQITFCDNFLTVCGVAAVAIS